MNLWKAASARIFRCCRAFLHFLTKKHKNRVNRIRGCYSLRSLGIAEAPSAAIAAPPTPRYRAPGPLLREPAPLPPLPTPSSALRGPAIRPKYRLMDAASRRRKIPLRDWWPAHKNMKSATKKKRKIRRNVSTLFAATNPIRTAMKNTRTRTNEIHGANRSGQARRADTRTKYGKEPLHEHGQ